MRDAGKSRWADSEEDQALEAQRKREKEDKKRAKTEKARLEAEAVEARQRQEAEAAAASREQAGDYEVHDASRASKRRKVSAEAEGGDASSKKPLRLFRPDTHGWGPSRHISNFELLNHIEEGSYGWVSRAKETATGEIVALKRLKMDGSDHNGFPVTGLREIQCLQQARHKHIVGLREVVVGDMLSVYLVMDFVEHDLKTLQEDMREPFSTSEVKTLLLQLGDALSFLQDHWILHRDLKTSNILLNNRGEIKLADFGMARHFGDPRPKMTQLVVTLWYRAPELLLGAEDYDTAIDMWSVGCIFGELLTRDPLLQGKNEVDQLSKAFELCGIPTDQSWPGFRKLPNAKMLRLPRVGQSATALIREKFPFITSAGTALLASLLSLNPARRPSARELLAHPFFEESPRPQASAFFPSFPSKAGQEKRRKVATPSAPVRGAAPKFGAEAADFSALFSREHEEVGAGFQLKLKR